MKIIIKIITSIILLLNITVSYAIQENTIARDFQDSTEIKRIFLKIEEGLMNGDIKLFSEYFSNNTYLSLNNGISGYFSSNQSYYILYDYLVLYKPVNFKFSSTVIKNKTPFASGVLKYNYKGSRGSAQVFISVKYAENKWYISQLTMN